MPKYAKKTDFVQRTALYQAGLNDRQIADSLGTKRSTITVWRRARGLPANFRPNAMSADDTAIRLVLYSLGWSDYHVSAELKRDRTSVRGWRTARGLDPNFPPGANERYTRRPTIADVVEKCRRSVGRYLPRDIAEDAVSDLMVDIMTGKLALDKISDAAKKYGNRVVAAFADKWGARSLDEEIGDSEGFTLLDTIADDSASSWLEEMGATVW